MLFHISVLILEHHPSDVETFVQELRAAGLDPMWRRVDTEADYLANLDPAPDIILADYQLPGFHALLALQLLQARGLDIPLIVIAGAANEEAAVECMMAGAADYLIKDRLQRLGQAVARALSAKQLRDDKRRAEAELRRSEERYRILLESVADAIAVRDLEGRYVTVNQSFASRFGLTPEQIIGKTPEDLFSPDNAALIRRGDVDAVQAGAFIDGELEHDTPTGRRTFHVQVLAMRDDQGVALGVVSVARDITERKIAGQALRLAVDEARRSRAEAIALLKSAQAVLEDFHFEDAAQRILAECRLLVGAHVGYVGLLNDDGQMNQIAAQDLGRPFHIVQSALPLALNGVCETARDTGRVLYDNNSWSCGCVALMSDGDSGIRNVLCAPMSVQGIVFGLLTLGNKAGGFTDDDVRLASGFAEIAAIAFQNSRVLRTLERSEQRFRSVAETANDAIIVVDSSAKIILWNRAAETIFGFSAAEAVSQSFDIVVPERLRETWWLLFERAFSEWRGDGESSSLPVNLGGRTLEGTGLRKDGTEIPIEVSNAFWQVEQEAFSTVIVRDITERKAMQREHEQAQRLEMAGQIAGQVAHDLNSMLSPLAGYPELIKARLPEGHPAVQYCDEILKSSRQIANVTEDLLALGRRGRLDPKPASLNDIVRAAAEQVAGRNTGPEIDLRLAEGLPMIVGSEAQLLRVVANLLANAQDAVQGSGTISVTTEKVHLDRPFGRYDRAEANKYVKLSIADSGRGISPDILPRIFDPFFSTKRMDERRGSGLGLTIVRQIVDDHHGHLDVQSDLGTGTTFTVHLPASQE